MGIFRKSLTPEQATQKLKQYCGYQERSHQEVQQKLYELGVWKQDHDAIIADLIEGDYLNEERFVTAFARGRFRLKQWGRIKIRYELQQRRISEYLLKKALAEIQEEEYAVTLAKLATEKYDSLKAEQYMVRQKKTLDYMTAKGYEMHLVRPFLEDLVRANRLA
ncbi:MAG: RecX family transcriptional regulator [Chitinophagaceae bacterium]|nr:MAG: RecX family transcriptional regulator [Chitinophagaceae bacterium]